MTTRERFAQIKKDIRVANEYENNFGGNEHMLFPLVERLLDAIEEAHKHCKQHEVELRDGSGVYAGCQINAGDILIEMLERALEGKDE